MHTQELANLSQRVASHQVDELLDAPARGGVYIYIHICTYVHMYIYIYTYIHTHTHTYIYKYTYIHVYTCIYIYAYIFRVGTSRDILWSIIYFPHWKCHRCDCHKCDIWCDICDILWNLTMTKKPFLDP